MQLLLEMCKWQKIPVFGSIKPAITLSNVVLPHPLGPKIAVSFPDGIFNETFSNATTDC